MFVMHDSRPQLLTTLVSPSDVMAFGGDDPSARYVLYSDAQTAAWVTELREGVKVSLKRAQSDVITVVPLRELKGLSLAPIGATLPRDVHGSTCMRMRHPAVCFEVYPVAQVV